MKPITVVVFSQAWELLGLRQFMASDDVFDRSDRVCAARSVICQQVACEVTAGMADVTSNTFVLSGHINEQAARASIDTFKAFRMGAGCAASAGRPN